MSVVVYRDGVLAADSRAYGGNWQASPGTKNKIHRLPDGSLLGITSSRIGAPERVLAWVQAGAVGAEWVGDFPDLRAMLIKPDGALYLLDASPWFTGPITTDRYAIGSGSDFAQGAMAMGAAADEAVRIAMRLDPMCGEPVKVLHLNP